MHVIHNATILLLITFVSVTEATVSVPLVISDHMVLQRESRVPIWGWADPGETITVTLGELKASTRANNNGAWRVDLQTGPAGGPYTLSIIGLDPAETIVIEDVLLGEVWLCSGQSNMQWPVWHAANADAEIAAAKWPQIRHLKVPPVTSSQPQEDQKGTWQICSPKTVRDFTAVGYYFGRSLHRELNVPIGLINCSWGGSHISSWTPVESLEMIESLESYRWRARVKDPTSVEYTEAATDYLQSVDDWLSASRAIVAKHGHFDTDPPTLPGDLKSFTNKHVPAAAFNGMIHPIMPFRVRGAIWYQGESNRYDTDYYDKSIALVRGWRKVWQEDMPFIYVQIPPYQYGNDPSYILPRFWAQQARLEATVGDTYMVSIHDIGDISNIHPRNKQDVGKRLASRTLAKIYNLPDIDHAGPRFKEFTADGDKLRVVFDHSNGGLTTRDGEPVDGFQIIGPNTGWIDADAIIDGDCVVLQAANVKQPVAVRFGWHKLVSPNLTNATGLPTSPFCVGHVPDAPPLLRDVTEDDNYKLVYDLDLHKLDKLIRYEVDRRAEVTGPFDRIAYFLELQKPGESLKWVYVSMDAFTDDLNMIAIPTLNSGASFQQSVSHMFITTNVDSLSVGDSVEGNIEFWPNSYGGRSTAAVPEASSTLRDFGDTMSPGVLDGYGSMQVHFTEAKTTLFAINNWGAGDRADIGIGNNTTGAHPDWSFSENGNSYEVKRLRVFVRPISVQP
jgi:sialate O-acetylesterase